jgi:hypothetical protein
MLNSSLFFAFASTLLQGAAFAGLACLGTQLLMIAQRSEQK